MEGEGLDFGDSPAPAVEGEQPLLQQDETIPEQNAGMDTAYFIGTRSLT